MISQVRVPKAAVVSLFLTAFGVLVPSEELQYWCI